MSFDFKKNVPLSEFSLEELAERLLQLFWAYRIRRSEQTAREVENIFLELKSRGEEIIFSRVKDRFLAQKRFSGPC